jgi:exoribonuclease R
VCKIKKWSNIDKNPIGTILEIIGTCGEFENESLVCLKRAHIKNVTDEVPKDVDKHLKGLIEDMGKGNIQDYVPRIDLSKELSIFFNKAFLCSEVLFNFLLAIPCLIRFAPLTF